MDRDPLLNVDPVKVRIDASTHCQLHCPLCPTEEKKGRDFLRRGYLDHGDFVRFLDANPRIREVELANAGEALLNPELAKILKSAAERGVATNLGGGVNMNDVTDDVLDALVRYGTRRVRISIDGVTEETYRKYRVGGSLRRVLDNINQLNKIKRRYGSTKPELVLQFIIFGHNEHELEPVRVLARMLNMNICVKLNRLSNQLEIRDRQRIRRIFGYADRREYLDETGTIYCLEACISLWKSPQVNWDGRLLGCCCNVNMSFAPDALGADFTQAINNERMRYARRMLLGEAPARPDIPCSTCPFYAQMQSHSLWITREEIALKLGHKPV